MGKSASRLALVEAQKWLAEMEAATALDDLAHAWELFLIYHQRVWNKSEAHYRGEPFWTGIRARYSTRRKQDLVLEYVHQARHADEHGVDLISEVASAQTRVMGLGTIIGGKIVGGGDFDLAPGSTVSVLIDPATIVAREVTNRGVRFAVPSVPGNGRPHSVIAIARHALQFYDDLFRDIDAAGGD